MAARKILGSTFHNLEKFERVLFFILIHFVNSFSFMELSVSSDVMSSLTCLAYGSKETF